jgi:predicted DNA-binding transcriptional regulator AlpA
MIKSSPRRSIKRKLPPARAPMPVVAPVVDSDMPTTLIFKKDVVARVGFSYPTLWNWMRDGIFPLSIDVGGKTAWRESEIDHWLATRPRSKLKGV